MNVISLICGIGLAVASTAAVAGGLLWHSARRDEFPYRDPTGRRIYAFIAIVGFGLAIAFLIAGTRP